MVWNSINAFLTILAPVHSSTTFTTTTPIPNTKVIEVQDRAEMTQESDKIASASGLIQLAGSRPLFPEEIRTRVSTGARLVRFEICLSFLFATIRRQSPLYLTESWQERYMRGFCYSVLTLFFGLWGIPWGLIWTPRAIWVNLTGGVDETEKAMKWIEGFTGPELTGKPH
jgi:hypothetical protein